MNIKLIPIKKNNEYKKLKKAYLFSNSIGINTTAFEIYSLCDGNNDVQKIFLKMCEKYHPETEEQKKEILSDTYECIENLKNGELIELEEADEL
ncbi:MAG: PqqD family peptide modification chaperone [Pseudomonadota bacterium]